MSSDQYGPGYGQGAPGYGPPPGGQGGAPGYGPPPGGQGGTPGYGPPPGGQRPGYGSPAGPAGYGPGPGPVAPAGYGPGPYGAPPQQAAGFPVKVAFQYPEKLSRGLIFIKWLLVIPHIIVLYILFLCMGIVSFIAWFAILFTGRYPRGMWDFTTGVIRWQTRVASYMYLQHDAYPPFSLQDE